MLLSIDLDEDFINVKGVAIAPVLSLQSPGVNGSEFDAPKTDGLASDDDSSFSQEVLDISVAEIEAIVEPDCIANDIWWEPVKFLGIHSPILSISAD